MTKYAPLSSLPPHLQLTVLAVKAALAFRRAAQSPPHQEERSWNVWAKRVEQLGAKDIFDGVMTMVETITQTPKDSFPATYAHIFLNENAEYASRDNPFLGNLVFKTLILYHRKEDVAVQNILLRRYLQSLGQHSDYEPDIVIEKAQEISVLAEENNNCALQKEALQLILQTKPFDKAGKQTKQWAKEKIKTLNPPKAQRPALSKKNHSPFKKLDA